MAISADGEMATCCGIDGMSDAVIGFADEGAFQLDITMTTNGLFSDPDFDFTRDDAQLLE